MACSLGKLLGYLPKPCAASFSKLSIAPLLVKKEPLLIRQPLVSCMPVSCCSTWSQRQKPKANKKKKFENEDHSQIPGTRFQDGPNKYQPKSPFKISTPRSYGFHENLFKGGVLPRDDKPFRSMKKYRPVNRWDEKHSLFGQNDYIDILGDGDVHPADLQKGPSWLIGQKDRSELHRLVRRLRMTGGKMKNMYPSKYEAMNKRVQYLYRRYNKHRSPKIS
ncbi:39S ribosomal protein L51, mitochondrial-like [Pecten maximus]|uniref:39S ribosomal protein L51, mitochondrial-like n=1 Tax=Pecten maximus TaxID=6579 RepID=UPI0014581B80|nr:39S ribosomal protein L51, mitochondrial-like [Pecten maximus]XP_033764321.1 39S ribosomal protein L51, mitochondrial-like [Pecten maximus]XP_033764322.1 39S ribosomal protein L51, mitochondrial-like [Pecten maximus]XP_033764323.1 39S ribosomal protein L51, mitochondrial-like [Pecten maximus]